MPPTTYIKPEVTDEPMEDAADLALSEEAVKPEPSVAIKPHPPWTGPTPPQHACESQFQITIHPDPFAPLALRCATTADSDSRSYSQQLEQFFKDRAPQEQQHALQDYHMQLMLLEQQNKKRLLMARQEREQIESKVLEMQGMIDHLKAEQKPRGTSRLTKQNYETQLARLKEEGEKAEQLKVEQDAISNSQTQQGSSKLRDQIYQLQLALIEMETELRIRFARQESEAVTEQTKQQDKPFNQLSEHQIQLLYLELAGRKRMLQARHEQRVLPDQPKQRDSPSSPPKQRSQMQSRVLEIQNTILIAQQELDDLLKLSQPYVQTKLAHLKQQDEKLKQITLEQEASKSGQSSQVYQLGLMLLEIQNRLRLRLARQEQDAVAKQCRQQDNGPNISEAGHQQELHDCHQQTKDGMVELDQAETRKQNMKPNSCNFDAPSGTLPLRTANSARPACVSKSSIMNGDKPANHNQVNEDVAMIESIEGQMKTTTQEPLSPLPVAPPQQQTSFLHWEAQSRAHIGVGPTDPLSQENQLKSRQQQRQQFLQQQDNNREQQISISDVEQIAARQRHIARYHQLQSVQQALQTEQAQYLQTQQLRAQQAACGLRNNHALQDHQMQLMLLEQQNKKRLLMAQQESESNTRDRKRMMTAPAGTNGDSRPLAKVEPDNASVSTPASESATSSNCWCGLKLAHSSCCGASKSNNVTQKISDYPMNARNHALQDYQMQLMLLEAQNVKRGKKSSVLQDYQDTPRMQAEQQKAKEAESSTAVKSDPQFPIPTLSQMGSASTASQMTSTGPTDENDQKSKCVQEIRANRPSGAIAAMRKRNAANNHLNAIRAASAMITDKPKLVATGPSQPQNVCPWLVDHQHPPVTSQPSTAFPSSQYDKCPLGLPRLAHPRNRGLAPMSYNIPTCFQYKNACPWPVDNQHPPVTQTSAMPPSQQEKCPLGLDKSAHPGQHLVSPQQSSWCRPQDLPTHVNYFNPHQVPYHSTAVYPNSTHPNVIPSVSGRYPVPPTVCRLPGHGTNPAPVIDLTKDDKPSSETKPAPNTADAMQTAIQDGTDASEDSDWSRVSTPVDDDDFVVVNHGALPIRPARLDEMS